SGTVLGGGEFDRTHVGIRAGALAFGFIGLGGGILLASLLVLDLLFGCGSLFGFGLLVRGLLIRLSLAIRSLAVQAGDGLLGVLGQATAWVAAEEFLERGAGFVRIVEIVFVDFADGEKGVEAIFAAGIFAAQELVLGDGSVEDLVVLEAAAHLHQRFGCRY